MARITYKNKLGNKIPSVTTILGIIEKPALRHWANKIGLQGIKMTEYVDDKAMIGTLAHYIIECHLNRIEPDFSEFKCDDEQIAQAFNCAAKYFEWETYQAELKPVATELRLVSEEQQYGGTLDFLAILNGKLTLIDFKTCNAIYDEPYWQTAAYKRLADENMPEIKAIAKEKFNVEFEQEEIEQIVILRIGRDEDEGFEYIEHKTYLPSLSTFLSALGLYWSKKNFEHSQKKAQKAA